MSLFYPPYAGRRRFPCWACSASSRHVGAVKANFLINANGETGGSLQ
ncbi:hypothetical protein JHU04_002606 [Brenneria sp. 4F2]|nr:hypothetical protein [Brenneria bubanii]